MEILRRGTTPDGIEIKLEKWRIFHEYSIIAYPPCKIDDGVLYKKGKPFMLEISFHKYNLNMEDCLSSEVMEVAKTAAETCFSCLESGEKFLENYSRYFWNEIDDIERLTGTREI